MRWLMLLPLALCLPTTGCFQNYWANRRRDLHESFLYDAQVGVGLDTDVRIGPFAWGIGLGSKSVAAVGKVNWWTPPTAFNEINISFLGGALLALTGQLPDMPGRLALAMTSHTVLKEVDQADSSLAGLVYERLSMLGVGNLIRLGRRDQGSDPRRTTAFMDASFKTAPVPRPPPKPRRHTGLSTKHKFIDQFGIEVGAFGGVVGTRVGFNPLEFADFLLGFIGLDLLFDDR
jgi:hypothetical protein